VIEIAIDSTSRCPAKHRIHSIIVGPTPRNPLSDYVVSWSRPGSWSSRRLTTVSHIATKTGTKNTNK